MRIKENDNKQQVQLVRNKLKENNGYCPCKLLKNEDTKCMCKEFREADIGLCSCGLYIKLEK